MITPLGIAGALQLTLAKNGVTSVALTSRGAEGAGWNNHSTQAMTFVSVDN